MTREMKRKATVLQVSYSEVFERRAEKNDVGTVTVAGDRPDVETGETTRIETGKRRNPKKEEERQRQEKGEQRRQRQRQRAERMMDRIH